MHRARPRRSTRRTTCWRSTVPSIDRASASVTRPPPKASIWSRSDSASRRLPSAERASSCTAGGSKATPSAPRMCCSRAAIRDAGQALQVELQAARQHGDRQLLRVRGRQQELDVRRRLLERLQERVERVRRQHVDFVDQVDLVAPACRQVLDVLEQLARVVDLRARGRVHLDQVHEAALVDLAAGAAFAAGRRTDAAFAVQRPGEDARDRRLADAARAREQECMVDAPRVQGIRQGLAHVFLADQLGEVARAPFAGKDEVTHGFRICRSAIIAHPRAGWRRPAPAPLRHPMPPLPLLPSGPGGVHG